VSRVPFHFGGREFSGLRPTGAAWRWFDAAPAEEVRAAARHLGIPEQDDEALALAVEVALEQAVAQHRHEESLAQEDREDEDALAMERQAETEVEALDPVLQEDWARTVASALLSGGAR
jgi:hypothetical protein